MRPVNVLGAVILCLLSTACAVSGNPVVCTAQFVYGLNIQVQDSVTGAWIASGATLIARDGAFVDSVGAQGSGPEWDQLPLATAGERAGTYDVTVRREGYHPWDRNGIEVEGDTCHVRPVNLVARLQPRADAP